MEAHGEKGPEKGQTEAVEAAVFHRGIRGQSQDGKQGRDQSDPLQKPDLGKDHGQGEEHAAQGEGKPAPFDSHIPQKAVLGGLPHGAAEDIRHALRPPSDELVGRTSHLGTPLPLRSNPLVNQMSAGGMTNSRPRR